MKNASLLFLLTCLFATLFAAEGDEELSLNSIALPTQDELAAVEGLGPAGAGFLPDTDTGPSDDDEVDSRILRDFIESRALIKTRLCSGTLTLAGDARARWMRTAERVNGVGVRGSNQNQIAQDIFKSEFNLFVDYSQPCSWVSTKLRWTVISGKDGGSATKVDLERAFLGYDFYHYGDTDLYIEMGRSRLDFIFDSRVEFSAVFDGLHLYYTQHWGNWTRAVIHGGPFLVDPVSNHYGWIIETALYEINCTGFLVKYSIIDWGRKAPTRYVGNLTDEQLTAVTGGDTFIKNNPRYRFQVSQVMVGWEGNPCWALGKYLYFYGAGLINTRAPKKITTDFKRVNRAWYIGFTWGKLCAGGDWSIDINYEYVQAQSIPEFDIQGIGHGNGAEVLLSDGILQKKTAANGKGFTNFKGFQYNFLYAFTDSFSVRMIYESSVPVNRGIGGDFQYQNFELSTIFAF